MPDLPPQTVTEEHYTDEHGHMVVKKVKYWRLRPRLPVLVVAGRPHTGWAVGYSLAAHRLETTLVCRIASRLLDFTAV